MRRDVLACTLAMAIVLSAAYARIIFRGKSLVYSDNLNLMLLGPNTGPGTVPEEAWQSRNLLFTANFHDPWAALGQWEPAAGFFRKSVQGGEWPLWNPFNAAGAPFFVDLTSSITFPPYLLAVLAGNTSLLRNVYALFLLLVAGVFTALFLRRHNLSTAAAIAGGIAYMLAGGVTQDAGAMMGQAPCLLPLALFVTRHFFEKPGGRRVAALAIVYACIALTEFPPKLVAVFGTVAAYAVWTIVTNRRSGLLYAGAVALSVGLAAFFLIPVAALIGYLPPYLAANYARAGLHSAPPIGFLQFLGPTLLDGAKIYADPPMRDVVHIYQVMPYAGVVAIFLALLSGFRLKRSLASFSVLMLVLITLKVLGVPPIHWIGYLPLLRNVHFVPYLGFLYTFFFACLAAIGLDELRSGRVSWKRAAFASAVVAALLGALLFVASKHGALSHRFADSWIRDWSVVAILATAVTILIACRSVIPPAAITAIVIALVAAEGIYNTARHPRQKRIDVWRNPPPYVQWLAKNAGPRRSMAIGSALHPNSSAAFHVNSVDSQAAINPYGMVAVYRRYGRPDTKRFLRHADRVPPQGVLDAMAVELLVIYWPWPEWIAEVQRRGYREVYSDPICRIFELPGSNRFFFSSDYRVLDRDAMLAALGNPRNAREILLDRPPSFPRQPNRADDPAVRVVRFGMNGFTLNVDAPRRGLVYCAESFFAGWRATVNGRAQEIRQANLAFRGVEVPAGRSVVEFRYRPPGLAAGLVVSGAAAIVALALLFRRVSS